MYSIFLIDLFQASLPPLLDTKQSKDGSFKSSSEFSQTRIIPVQYATCLGKSEGLIVVRELAKQICLCRIMEGTSRESSKVLRMSGITFEPMDQDLLDLATWRERGNSPKTRTADLELLN